MKMIAWLRHQREKRSLRVRLLLVIGLILFICQSICVLWLWHESKEQIHTLVAASISNHLSHRHRERELHETVASLALPSLLMITLTLLICFQAIKRITSPLSELQHHLETRDEESLTPVDFHSSVKEIDAVTEAINRLVLRLISSLERERLFTSDVAHELRTPLAGLRLHLELLGKTNKVDISPLVLRLDQMTSSVTQLLQLARVGQSFSSGHYQKVALIQDVIEPMRHELETMLAQHQQRLVLNISNEVTVRGDATLIRVLMRNLLENAHRYSPQHSCITVRVEPHPHPALIVEDEGKGIDESKLGELSQAFVRMDSRYGGIGLGLSIVTRIVQLHNGRFLLENRRNGPGCCARVLFKK